jgi:hypothetical protein
MSSSLWIKVLMAWGSGLVLVALALIPVLAAQPGGAAVWRQVASPVSDYTLFDVAMVSRDEAWAVGTTDDYTGAVLHYANGKWQPHLMLGDTGLHALDVVSSSSVWAIDWDNHVLHYDGSSWLTTTLAEGTYLGALDMLSDTSGWAVDLYGYDILHYDGITWTASPISMTQSLSTDWKDIEMVTSNDGWLAGAYHSGFVMFQGAIVHYDGSQWSEFQLMDEAWIWGVSSVATDDVWAVGANYSSAYDCGLIMHYTGTTFVPISTTWPLRPMLDVQMVAADDGWAVDNGGSIYHYDGVEWQEVASPTTEALHSVAMDRDGSAWGWSVGSNGTILRYGYPTHLPIVVKSFR